MIEIRLTMQPKATPHKYEKGMTFVPKDKGPFARAEPCLNQRKVFLALQANGSLPKPKPMKPAIAEACKESR